MYPQGGLDSNYTQDPIVTTRAALHDCLMSVAVWVMISIAVWHFVVFVPDKFYGGIIGAFLASVAGGLASGYLLPLPGIPSDNPPGLQAAIWPLPGILFSLAASYAYGERHGGERGMRL